MKDIIKFILFLTYISICISEDIRLKLKNENKLKKENSSSNEESPEPLGTPEALIRYRHEIPITIIKQKTQKIKRRPKPKIRRRVKQPKIKYGPPGYASAEPLSYYKFIDNVHENHQSASSPFTSSSHFNEYENFYKELGPDFNFEDVTFSEYEKQPIEFDLYDEKTYQKYLLQHKFNQGKLNGREKHKTTKNHWTDIPASHSLDYQETYDIPEESYWHHSSKFKKPSRKPIVTDNKYSFAKDIPREKYKETQSDYHIPHTKYGIPDSEFSLPKKKKQYHFGEPPEEISLYDKPPNVEIHVPKNHKKVKTPHFTATKTYSGETNFEPPHKTKPPQFIQPPEEDETYFPESPKYENNFQQDKHILNYQQELPLQNDAKFTYDFSKSSYDVPLYDAMPFRNDDQSNDNYPPLNDSYSITSESQSLPSKISLIYAARNATLIPPGYFAEPSNIRNNSVEKSTEKSRKIHQTRFNNKRNRTRRRKIKDRNSESLLPKVTDSNISYNEDYLSESDQKFENTEKSSTVTSIFSTESIPLNLLLLSSANRNPGSHISSLKWDPMKVTSYHFKINHDNISASIPNIKAYDKTETKISTTTPTYKKRGKTRKNRNFGSTELNTTKNPYLQNVYTRTIPPEYFIRANEMIPTEDSQDSETSEEEEENTSEYETFENPDDNIKNDDVKLRENLKLIRDPFSFNNKNNATAIESQTLRYKNHRYY